MPPLFDPQTPTIIKPPNTTHATSAPQPTFTHGNKSAKVGKLSSIVFLTPPAPLSTCVSSSSSPRSPSTGGDSPRTPYSPTPFTNRTQQMTVEAAGFHQACRFHTPAAVLSLLRANPKLLETRNNRGSTGFWTACRYGRRHVVRALLIEAEGQGVDLNIPDVFGDSAFLTACMHGCIAVVKMLHRSHARWAEARNIYGWTPFYAACSQAQRKVALYLLRHGIADVHTPTVFATTPMASAALVGDGEIVRALLRRRVGVHAMDLGGATAIHHSVHWGRASVCGILVRAVRPRRQRAAGSNGKRLARRAGRPWRTMV